MDNFVDTNGVNASELPAEEKTDRGQKIYEQYERSLRADELSGGKQLRRALNFSVAGLILSIFFGVGSVFGAIGMILGILNRKKDQAASRYAIGIGIAAIVLSIIFAVLIAIVAFNAIASAV